VVVDLVEAGWVVGWVVADLVEAGWAVG